MLQRIVTGLIGIPIVYIALATSVETTFLGVSIICAIACHEFIRLTDYRGLFLESLFFVLVGVLLVMSLLLPFGSLWLFYGLVALGLVVNAMLRFIPRWYLLGAAYVGLPMSLFVAIRGIDDGFSWLIVLLVATWTTDTMALFGGLAYGKTPFSKISPNKTWEGTLTGVVLGAIGTLIAAQIMDLWQDNTLIIIMAAVLLPPAAIAGDLIESAIKRYYGKKDSGTILPGHGGILDRIDSLILTTICLGVLLILA